MVANSLISQGIVKRNTSWYSMFYVYNVFIKEVAKIDELARIDTFTFLFFPKSIFVNN